MAGPKFKNTVYFTGGTRISEVFVAGEDLSTCQYRFVRAGSVVGEVRGATGASNPTPLGVLQNAPTVCQPAIVTMFGITYLAGSPNSSTCDLIYGRFLTGGCLGGAVALPGVPGCQILGRWLDSSVLAAASSASGKAAINCLFTAGCAQAAC